MIILAVKSFGTHFDKSGLLVTFLSYFLSLSQKKDNFFIPVIIIIIHSVVSSLSVLLFTAVAC